MVKTEYKVEVSPSLSPQEDRNCNKLPPVEDSHEDDEDCRWGWLGFRPQFLQPLLSPRWFLFFITLFSLAQGMSINSFVSISIPTLEKQFSFSSTQTGVIVSSNDITALLLVCFVSFRGDYGHKTKWLGSGALLTGIGCILFALPNFLIERIDPAKYSEESSAACTYNTTQYNYGYDQRCSKHGNDEVKYLLVFILSQLLSGAGTTPLHTIGTAYIDENVHPKHTSTYIGIFYATIMLGPGLGSIIGGNLLSIYVDLKLPPNVVLSSKDAAWIGAWWLGPFACGCLLLVLGIILLGFPKRLPNSIQLRQEAIARGLIKKEKRVSGNFRDILPVTKALLANGTFMCQNLALVVSALIGGGLGPFLFKLIRTMYGASASIIGLSIAMILILGAGGGIAIGSFLVKKLCAKDSCKTAAKITFILQLTGIWTGLIFLIPGCEYSNFAGIDQPYENSNITSGVISHCNKVCNCSTSIYRPVCGPGGLNYYSPCLAGCSSVTNQSYTRCLCLSSSIATLKDGLCERNCKNLIFFLAGAVVLTIFSFSNTIPSKIVTLRSVADNQRGYALGLQLLFLRTLGSLPGPILFGQIIDTTCTMWQTKCGKTGNCLNYNHSRLSWILIATSTPTYGLSCVAYYFSWHYSKKQKERQNDDVTLSSVNGEHDKRKPESQYKK